MLLFARAINLRSIDGRLREVTVVKVFGIKPGKEKEVCKLSDGMYVKSFHTAGT